MAVTAAQVAALFSDPPSEESAAPFLATAELEVSEKLANSNYSSSRKDQITLYLAAHFLTAKKPVLKRRKIGQSEDEYAIPSQGKEFSLSSTKYGSMVQTLDFLRFLSTSPKAEFTLL